MKDLFLTCDLCGKTMVIPWYLFDGVKIVGIFTKAEIFTETLLINNINNTSQVDLFFMSDTCRLITYKQFLVMF